MDFQVPHPPPSPFVCTFSCMIDVYFNSSPSPTWTQASHEPRSDFASFTRASLLKKCSGLPEWALYSYLEFWAISKGGGAKILKKEIALLMMIWNRKWKYSCRKIMYSIDLFQYCLYSWVDVWGKTLNSMHYNEILYLLGFQPGWIFLKASYPYSKSI